MSETSCPLCDQLAKYDVSEKLDVANVTCDVCGRYDIEDPLLSGISEDVLAKNDRYLLSGLTRRAFEQERKVSLTFDDLGSTLESISVETDPTERMNRTLLHVSDHQTRADAYVEFDIAKDYPLVFARDSEEFYYIIGVLRDMGLLESPPYLDGGFRYRLTLQGWETVGQLRQAQTVSNQAFVAMWFTPDLKSAYTNGFKKALEATGFMPYRVDFDEFSGKIGRQDSVRNPSKRPASGRLYRKSRRCLLRGRIRNGSRDPGHLDLQGDRHNGGPLRHSPIQPYYLAGARRPQGQATEPNRGDYSRSNRSALGLEDRSYKSLAFIGLPQQWLVTAVGGERASRRLPPFHGVS